MIQNSYSNEKSKLYIVPTPIGNLKDITYRAVEVLTEVNAIFAEDTRVTNILLNNLNIKNKVYACHKFNELKVSAFVLKLLEEGNDVALVTDRGTPLISDPGSVVVDKVIERGYNVIALPGASALLPALNMSGISSEKFLFFGFLNSKESQGIKELEKLKDLPYTIIFYESPQRLSKTLNNIYKILGNRKISVIREISKLHEEVFRGKTIDAMEYYKDVKGEIVIVVEKCETLVDYEIMLQKVYELINQGFTPKDAIKSVSKLYDVSKNILYKMYEERKK